ncbi:MAG TPA: hypothetical protein PLE19_12850 [Planctomycetota bacterium]|nr:hypothetical protein [Planctomycetota bacterium]HRR82926.1 hypothetical protein [Planctomycetota bacterium]HRT94782.1 hypothetical protein [Planctomycetota bacterium]
MYARVWEHARVGGTDLLVLLALAEHVRPGAYPCCFPSKVELARLARTSKRTVDACIARLIEAGEIVEIDWREVSEEATRWIGKFGRSNLYVVATGAEAEEVTHIVCTLRGIDSADIARSLRSLGSDSAGDGAVDSAGDGAVEGASSAPKSWNRKNRENRENPGRGTHGPSQEKPMSDGASSAPSIFGAVLGRILRGETFNARLAGIEYRVLLSNDRRAIVLRHLVSGDERRIETDADLVGVDLHPTRRAMS